ncbi:tumor necrosis factor receptor superfamily member 6B-like [Notolabrus celidotus]|uniref:tumor necrosis factor receptor superfamily member 6B-like n=1 Tax=Notolabrus celidotus TaxID=1203425 RepID=UPI00148FCB7A|nr:tumor necrosis factor receptor superfamily member 6B-like [Notolabrus celidotus]
MPSFLTCPCVLSLNPLFLQASFALTPSFPLSLPFQMLTTLLFTFTLLSSLTEGSPEPRPTFIDTDPVTGRSLECDRCPPGSFLRAPCTETQQSVCAQCQNGSFTELWNYIGKCLRCGTCGHNEVVRTECTTESDCLCECRPGYYKSQYSMCLQHSECPTGHEVLTQGSANQDTVCRACRNGTFSDVVSADKTCVQHKSCSGGLQLVLRGAAWHDAVCIDCQGTTSKDGADYLREILPAFFVHHKMSVRRLRHVLRILLLEDGKRHEGIATLYLPELKRRIDAWVASATTAQIRKIPSILAKAGAGGAAERLKNKLQRIDSNVGELCSLNNEINMVSL